MSKRVILAVEKERTSKSYAEKYYEEEKDLVSLFSFDTAALGEFLQKPGRLFDAMMGRGRQVIYFAKSGFDVVGNDYNPHMVQLTRMACQNMGLKVAFHNKDVTNLDGVQSGSFDYVICMANSLGCVPGSKNRQAAIMEFARILKPGGTLALHVFNRWACLFEPDERSWLISNYLNRDPDLEVGDWLFYHGKELGMTYNHIFSLGEARQLMYHARLRMEEVKYIHRVVGGYCNGYFKSFRAGSFLLFARKDV